MDQPLVSIIIPVYKVEKYLRRCLDSVQNQTYKNIEVIMVDDGSPDNCPQICDEYAAKDSRFHAIHKENGGLSSARNAGLDYRAKNAGGYIFFVDSDDYIHSNIVEKCICATDGKEVDSILFGSNHKLINNNGIEDEKLKIPEQKIYNCDDFHEILYGPIQNMYGIPATALCRENQGSAIQKYKRFVEVWCWLFSAKTIQDNQLRFKEDIICGEDEIFTCDFLAHANKIISISDVGYEYIVRYDGMSKTRSYAPYIIDNKIILVKYREDIRNYIFNRTHVDISEWAYGSYVLSIFQLCVALANEKHGYQQFKRYIALGEVKRAVKVVPLKGKLKLVLPLALCKCGCYRLVFAIISTLKKMGFSIGL